MKNLDEILSRLRQEKSFLAKNYHVAQLGIFGSTSRGEATPQSDIDILVEFSAPIGLDIVDLAEHLEDVLGVCVDLVPRDAIKARYWKVIQPEVRYV